MYKSAGFIFSVVLFSHSLLFAQMTRKDENRKWKEAQELFDQKQYDKAEPLFSHLLSQEPNSSALNYYYGVCLLITEKDKAKALMYLENAARDEFMWDQVYYYLGKAYHINSDFENAQRAYEQFKSRSSDKMIEQWNVDHALRSLNIAQDMMSQPIQFNIVDRYLKNSSNFFTAYQLEGKEGKILIKPQHLLSKQELSSGKHFPAFLSANGNVMYYTGYAGTKSNTSDIFRVVKNSDGTWGNPELLPSTINTKDEEVYPMCNEDGTILFFSSNGLPGMGSFDVFKSRYNTASQSWETPINIGYPINTADDDLYYTESSDGNTAFYATKYRTPFPKLMVYKIQYGEPNTILQVRGRIFLTDRLNEFNEVRITLSKQNSTEVLSSFLSNGHTGEYAFNLSEVGDYRIQVEAPGYSKLAQNITINNQSSGRMAQWIKLTKTKTHDEIFTVNKFLTEDETFDQGIEMLNQMHVGQLESDNTSDSRTVAQPSSNSLAEEESLMKSQTNTNTTSTPTTSNESTTSNTSALNVETNNHDQQPTIAQSTSTEDLTISTNDVVTVATTTESRSDKLSDAEQRLRSYFENNKSNINPTLPQPVKITEVLDNDNRLDFKVQIGTFSNQTAEEIFAKLVAMGFDDLCYLTTHEGWHIFLTGHGSNFDQIKQLQQTVFEYGFNDAYVVAYKNMKRVKVNPELIAGE